MRRPWDLHGEKLAVSRRRLLLFELLGFFILALLVFMTRGPERGPAPAPRSETSRAANDSTRLEAADSDPEPAIDSTAQAPALPEREPVVAATGSLLVHLSRPDGAWVGPAAEVRFFVDGIERPARNGDPPFEHRLDGLVPGSPEIRVELPGYWHDGTRVEVVAGQAREEDLIVFSPNYVSLVVETADGAGIETLAENFQMSREELIASSFSVSASNPAAPLREPYRLRLLEITDSTARGLPAHSVGLLRFHPPPPCVLELRFCGLIVGTQSVPHGSRCVRFVLDEALVAACFARVRVRIISSESGAPLTDALASLYDAIAARQRADLQELWPDAQGLIVFERVLPGDHEFVALREDLSAFQSRVHVERGEDLDLGSVSLDCGPALAVRVVGEKGEPVRAVVDLLFVEPGRSLQEAKTPFGAWTRDGSVRLPKPMRPAFLQAFDASSGILVRELIDPCLPSPGEITLVLASPRRVDFTTLRALGSNLRAEILSSAGGVLSRIGAHESGAFSMELAPGSYRIRLLDEAGSEVSSADFQVAEDGQRVELP